MKLDTQIWVQGLQAVPQAAKKAEELGFDAIWTAEAGNDGLLPLALVAEHTKRIKMGTAIAIAFPQSPMAMAYTAWDLAGMSQGRFILGLGTQVKGHIERRFGANGKRRCRGCANISNRCARSSNAGRRAGSGSTTRASTTTSR